MHEMTLDEMIALLEKEGDYYGSEHPDTPLFARQFYCIARYLKRLKWLLITEAQRSPTVDDYLLLGNNEHQTLGVGRNHSGEWECGNGNLYDFEIVHGWTPTHYMPLDVLPPVPKEATDANNSRTT